MPTSPATVHPLSPPVVEPVTLAEARQHLRLTVDERDQDAYILGLVGAARAMVEARLGVALSPQQFRATFPDGGLELRLPNPPLLTGASYPLVVAVDGTTLAESAYEVDSDARPAVVTLDSGTTAKTVVTYWAGAERIAPQIRSAILLLVGHLFIARDGAERVDMPPAVETLLASASVTGMW